MAHGATGAHSKGGTGTLIEAQGLPQFLGYLKKVGNTTMPTEIRLAGKKIAVEVADVVRGAIPHGKDEYASGSADKHPGQLAGSVRGLATAKVVHVQIGRGAAAAYARPQLFGGSKNTRYKHYYNAIMDRLEAITPQLIEEYQRALVDALDSAKV
jgi:hypothetical protein